MFTCTSPKPVLTCESLGFRSGVDEIYFLLRCDTVSEGNWFPTFRDNVVVSSSRVEMSKKYCIGNETTTLCRNIGNKLSSNTASYPRRVVTWKRRTEVIKRASGDLSPTYVRNKERKLYGGHIRACVFLVYMLPRNLAARNDGSGCWLWEVRNHLLPRTSYLIIYNNVTCLNARLFFLFCLTSAHIKILKH
jgi:hypothetical protein